MQSSLTSAPVRHHYMTIEDHQTTDYFLVENYLRSQNGKKSPIPDLQIVSSNAYGRKEPLLLELDTKAVPRLEVYNLETFNQRKSEILFEVFFSGPYLPAPVKNEYW